MISKVTKEVPHVSRMFRDEETSRPQVYWHDESPAADNFEVLGRALATLGDLFRRPGHDGGLFLVLPDGSPRSILKGKQLSAVIVDRIDLHRFHNEKQKPSRISVGTLDEMLHTEAFLSMFAPVDRITSQPEYLPGFTLTNPGYNDGGDGHRVIFVGESAEPSDSMERINTFLDVMDFHTPPDRANTVAGLLTVALRHHWPGGKPIILATATKSHSGKDTVLDFIAGQTPKMSVSWEPADWATQKAIIASLNQDPSLGMIRIENARVNGNSKIASAFVERFVTDPAPTLYSPGCGSEPRRIRNEIVMSMSTNFGSLSEDLLNRGLPIHLKPNGSITDRQSSIGSPRHQYLPRYGEEIAAEVHGMIERWRAVGMPLDDSRYHPCTEWAHVIGGILMVNGVEGFLDNYADRRVADDPIRSSIAVLGSHLLDKCLPISEVVAEVIRLGLTNPLVPQNERSAHEAQKRGLGKVLGAHLDEKFVVQSEDEEDERVVFRLEKVRRRFKDGKAESRYGFFVVEETERDGEDGPDDSADCVISQDYPKLV
jgi:hypothetical protein